MIFKANIEDELNVSQNILKSRFMYLGYQNLLNYFIYKGNQ